MSRRYGFSIDHGGGGRTPVPGPGPGPGPDPFNPLDDADLVALWLALDATDNGTALTVPDLGAGGFNLSATGTRALIDATGFAGGPALNFSALIAGNTPLTSVAIGAALAGNQKITLLTLAGHDPNPQTSAYLARYGTGAAGDWLFRTKMPSQGQISTQLIQGATNCELRSPIQSEKLLYPKVIAGQFDGALVLDQVRGNWENGKLMAGTYSTNGIVPATPGNKTLYICSNTNAASPFRGRWAGMAIVKRLLTTTEIATWSQWMRDQYGMGTPREILWVGDSITAASNGFRFYLQALFEAERGITVDWGTYETIGPLGNGVTFPENWADGVSGSTITQIATRMATTLASTSAYLPEIVALCNCGTNDVLADASAATIAGRWETLLTAIYDLRPTVRIKLISLINNTTSAARTQVVIDANLLGPLAVANAITSRPAMLAEWVNGPYALTLSDGTHPTTGAGGGYETMANALWPLIKVWP